ncbi:hypothetical protein ACJJTC_013203 [Scirpophaga incertulas]
MYKGAASLRRTAMLYTTRSGSWCEALPKVRTTATSGGRSAATITLKQSPPPPKKKATQARPLKLRTLNTVAVVLTLQPGLKGPGEAELPHGILNDRHGVGMLPCGGHQIYCTSQETSTVP